MVTTYYLSQHCMAGKLLARANSGSAVKFGASLFFLCLPPPPPVSAIVNGGPEDKGSPRGGKILYTYDMID